MPDGLAFDYDSSYVIILDAKVRKNKFSMGTEDRTFREYIITQSREQRKKEPSGISIMS